MVQKKQARKITNNPKDRGNFLGLFTVESWREFKRAGGQVMGFNDNKLKAASKLKPGDKILCYLTKVSTFIAVLEVTGPVYRDESVIWTDGVFPVRLPVRVDIECSMSNAVPIRSLKKSLSIFKGNKETGWTIYVRTSPRRWTTNDANVVIKALSSKRLSDEAEPILSNAKRQRSLTKNKFPKSLRVGRVVEKTRQLEQSETLTLLGSRDNVLSYNKVTGYSVNVPIANTCMPTAVCLKTCYFASGAPSWTNALRHQRKVYESMKADSRSLAERVALEYDRLGLTFLRWNGGGDLFPENIDTINYLGKIRPDIILWVVTRIPEMAAQIEDLPNVFIHFSLDKHSLKRRDKFLKIPPKSKNFFFSYQCDANEVPDSSNLDGISVLFFDNYKTDANLASFDPAVVCPLNRLEVIADACDSCRRCFNGNAVDHKNSCLSS